MAQVKVCSFAAGQNLDPLLALLQEQGIDYSLEHDRLGTQLYVDDSKIETVTALLDRVAKPTTASAPGLAFFRTVQQWPLTFIFVLLGGLGFVLASFDPQLIVLRWLTFTQAQVFVSYLTFSDFQQTYLQSHQWWRLISPTFLHFGIAHVLFNALALWEVGRRLEFCLRRRWYLYLFAAIAVFANFAQYWVFGPSLFGGLSGVLYGFFGVIPVLHYRTKHPLLALPKGLYVFLGVTLMLGPLGVMEQLFGLRVADGAHFGGLLCGVALAAMMPLSAVQKYPPPRATE